MTEPKKITAKLVNATYVKEAKSVVLLLEYNGAHLRNQIHRDQIATYGNRSEEEIDRELNKYVDTLKTIYMGKEINAVFDPDINNKIKDHYPLKY
jgi:hypothetical protein